MTQSTSISGPGNAPGIDGSGSGLKIFCVNAEKVIYDFAGPLVSGAGLSTLVVRLGFAVDFTFLETGCGLAMGVTLIGFEDGLVPEDTLGVAGAWGDDVLFCERVA